MTKLQFNLLNIQYQEGEQNRLAATVEAVIEDFFVRLEPIIARGEEWHPCVIAIKGIGAIGVPMSFANDKQKQEIFSAMNKALLVQQPDAAVFVSEAWMVIASTPYPEDIPELNCPPSEHPDRKECVVAVGQYDYGSIMVIRQIDRSGPTPKLLDAEEMGTQEAGSARAKIFDGVFKPAVPVDGKVH